MLSLENTPTVGRIAGFSMGSGLVLALVSTLWLARSRHANPRTWVWLASTNAAVVLFWCLAAAAFSAYWLAIFDSANTDIPRIVSCYLLSWAAGFLVLFAPQGIGVFEWVAAQLMPTSQTSSVTIIAVVGFRLVMIAGDLSAWILGLLISMKRRTSRQPPRSPEF